MIKKNWVWGYLCWPRGVSHIQSESDPERHKIQPSAWPPIYIKESWILFPLLKVSHNQLLTPNLTRAMDLATVVNSDSPETQTRGQRTAGRLSMFSATTMQCEVHGLHQGPQSQTSRQECQSGSLPSRVNSSGNEVVEAVVLPRTQRECWIWLDRICRQISGGW